MRRRGLIGLRVTSLLFGTTRAIGPKPWEQIFDDIAGGSRAEWRRRQGMPDDDELNAIESTHPTALVGVGSDAQPIVDAELVEPGLDGTDLPPRSEAEPASNAGWRTYTLSDFER